MRSEPSDALPDYSKVRTTVPHTPLHNIIPQFHILLCKTPFSNSISYYAKLLFWIGLTKQVLSLSHACCLLFFYYASIFFLDKS
ncbi:hypothetical protein RHMOL_Rhmol05G0266900 [Rhododendron molle]|uniref:Uncharacterized protein n=1 Tax=Rhododendron molle TaxID=49168 RepID=A0ACC0NTK6_RHOML|nr:hypothetical protein RHMOL_Rhmol05G0266900 [Rhododendron molle]